MHALQSLYIHLGPTSLNISIKLLVCLESDSKIITHQENIAYFYSHALHIFNHPMSSMVFNNAHKLHVTLLYVIGEIVSRRLGQSVLHVLSLHGNHAYYQH